MSLIGIILAATPNAGHDRHKKHTFGPNTEQVS